MTTIKDSLKKWLLLVGGSLSLALGCLGVFLPLLPTTPFLLLAAYCYLRSSAAMHAWLLGHKLLGPYIDNYLTHGAITRRARRGALIFLWLTLFASSLFISRFALKLLLLAVGTAISIHLFSLSTFEPLEADAGCAADDGIEPPQ